MDALIAEQRAFARRLSALEFEAPVAHVYNPLDYARRSAEAYLARYARPGVEALLLGMNPGPWGMSQTGVPFGEVEIVRDWLGIEEPVERPAREHEKRRIEGFACKRSEVSGRRLWGWARERFETPERFFERFFVGNWCPLAFLEESGKNLTPDKLAIEARAALFELCDEALRATVRILRPARVIGIGKFAEERARIALGSMPGEPPLISTILHPSPASPVANRGWARQAEAQLTALGIALPPPAGRARDDEAVAAPRPVRPGATSGSGTARASGPSKGGGASPGAGASKRGRASKGGAASKGAAASKGSAEPRARRKSSGNSGRTAT